jgi:hypothetical protein
VAHQTEVAAPEASNRTWRFHIDLEKDPIREIKGAMPVDATAFEALARIMHIAEKSYRYLEILPECGRQAFARTPWTRLER